MPTRGHRAGEEKQKKMTLTTHSVALVGRRANNDEEREPSYNVLFAAAAERCATLLLTGWPVSRAITLDCRCGHGLWHCNFKDVKERRRQILACMSVVEVEVLPLPFPTTSQTSIHPPSQPSISQQETLPGRNKSSGRDES